MRDIFMKVHNKASLKEIRRRLRKDSTPSEDILWQEVRNGKLNGLKFKRQHSIGNYIVDFYCATARLVIEVDGEIHLAYDQQEKDKLRDENLIDMGFKIIRFTNDEIVFNIDSVIKKILEKSAKKDLILNPSP